MLDCAMLSVLRSTIISLLAVFVASGAFAADRINGHATVIDGQTLKIDQATLQLHGVIAPPLPMKCQTKRDKPYNCGFLAKKALADMIKGHKLSCKIAATGEPPMVTCWIGPFSVNEQLLLTGRVLAAPDAGKGYQRAEHAAKVLNEGLWKGKFPPPETWGKTAGD